LFAKEQPCEKEFRLRLFFICAGVHKEYDNCAVRTPRGEYEAKVASYSIAVRKEYDSGFEK